MVAYKNRRREGGFHMDYIQNYSLEGKVALVKIFHFPSAWILPAVPAISLNT